MAAVMAAAMISASVVADLPVAAARMPSARTTCAAMRVSTFSAAQRAATAQFWTPRRIAAANRTPAGQGKSMPAASTTPPKDQEPATRTLCAARASLAPFPAGALLAASPFLPDAAATVSVAKATTKGKGKPALAGYPTVGVLYLFSGQRTTAHCTASTISPAGPNPGNVQDLLLTAAHCLEMIKGGKGQQYTNLNCSRPDTTATATATFRMVSGRSWRPSWTADGRGAESAALNSTTDSSSCNR